MSDALLGFARRYPRLFVLTGAGLSTGSGIPAYRDAAGAWQQNRPQPIQFQDFIATRYARQRYWARSMHGWPRFAQARPNAGHRALARLDNADRLTQLVTQNVDGLHQQAGSRSVIDLHGRLDRVSCLGCGYRLQRQAVQHWLERDNPEFRHHQSETVMAADGDAHLQQVAFEQFREPHCPRCNGILKPDVVFFGENVPSQRVDLARQRLQTADALLVVGSSLTVFSGYRFCRLAVELAKPIAAINLGSTRADAQLSLKIEQDCTMALQSLAENLI